MKRTLNTTINRSKSEKNDEHYTQLVDIEARQWNTVETHTFVWDGNNIVLEKSACADGTAHVCEYFWGMDKSGTEQGAVAANNG